MGLFNKFEQSVKSALEQKKEEKSSSDSNDFEWKTIIPIVLISLVNVIKSIFLGAIILYYSRVASSGVLNIDNGGENIIQTVVACFSGDPLQPSKTPFVDFLVEVMKPGDDAEVRFETKTMDWLPKLRDYESDNEWVMWLRDYAYAQFSMSLKIFNSIFSFLGKGSDTGILIFISILFIINGLGGKIMSLFIILLFGANMVVSVGLNGYGFYNNLVKDKEGWSFVLYVILLIIYFFTFYFTISFFIMFGSTLYTLLSPFLVNGLYTLNKGDDNEEKSYGLGTILTSIVCNQWLIYLIAFFTYLTKSTFQYLHPTYGIICLVISLIAIGSIIKKYLPPLLKDDDEDKDIELIKKTITGGKQTRQIKKKQ